MESHLNEDSCSVLLPLFNGSKYIRESLASIIPGLRANDELLIINDGSQDISDSELFNLQKIDQRINVINKKHSGLVETLNFGIKECRNELIARADVDDKYSPDRISIQVKFMSDNPDCAAVFSDYEIRSAQGDPLGVLPTAITPLATRFSLLNPQRTPHPSVMFRKSAVESVGAYKINEFPAEDLSLWIDLSATFEIATIPQTLLYYRLHKNNITSRFQNQMIGNTGILVSKLVQNLSVDEILDEILKTFEVYDGHTSAMDRKILMFRDLAKYFRISDNTKISKVVRHSAISALGQVIRPSAVVSVSRLRREQKLRKSNRSIPSSH